MLFKITINQIYSINPNTGTFNSYFDKILLVFKSNRLNLGPFFHVNSESPKCLRHKDSLTFLQVPVPAIIVYFYVQAHMHQSSLGCTESDVNGPQTANKKFLSIILA